MPPPMRIRFSFGQSEDAVVARGRRTGEHALADACPAMLCQAVDAEAETPAPKRRAVRRVFLRRNVSFDRRFDIAGDHAGRVAAHHRRGSGGPVRAVGRDDQPCGLDRKRFGKRVDNFDAVQLQSAVGGTSDINRTLRRQDSWTRNHFVGITTIRADS